MKKYNGQYKKDFTAMNSQRIIDLFIVFTIAITISVTAIGLLPLT